MYDDHKHFEDAPDASLQALRGVTVETPEEPAQVARFCRGVYRKAKLQSARRSFSFWMPAIVAGLCGIGLAMASVQLITNDQQPRIRLTESPKYEVSNSRDSKVLLPSVESTVR